jgi:hypothetical protein
VIGLVLDHAAAKFAKFAIGHPADRDAQYLK